MLEYTTTLKPTLLDVQRAREALDAFLQEHPISEYHATVLAFAELATNLVQHTENSVEKITFILKDKDSSLTLEFTDNGKPFHDFMERIKALPDTLTFDSMEHGGMGLFLVKQSFPQLLYSSGNGRNTLTARRTR